jgi:hypothetical protein
LDQQASKSRRFLGQDLGCDRIYSAYDIWVVLGPINVGVGRSIDYHLWLQSPNHTTDGLVIPEIQISAPERKEVGKGQKGAMQLPAKLTVLS